MNEKAATKNIRIATSEHLTGGYSKPSEPITGKYWAEGPTVLKTGEKWMVYFDKYTLHQYGAVESIDLKTWTEVTVNSQCLKASGMARCLLLPGRSLIN